MWKGCGEGRVNYDLFKGLFYIFHVCVVINTKSRVWNQNLGRNIFLLCSFWILRIFTRPTPGAFHIEAQHVNMKEEGLVAPSFEHLVPFLLLIKKRHCHSPNHHLHLNLLLLRFVFVLLLYSFISLCIFYMTYLITFCINYYLLFLTALRSSSKGSNIETC